MKTQLMLHMLALCLIFAAVLVGTFGAYSGGSFKMGSAWVVALFTAATVATIVIGMKRDTWLPFLGTTAAPLSAVPTVYYPKNASKTIVVRPPPGAVKVLYWAAERDAQEPRAAYGAMTNSGLVDVDAVDGTARLFFAPPGQYAVRGGTKVLPRHVHWRAAFANGMMSPVMTTDIE